MAVDVVVLGALVAGAVLGLWSLALWSLVMKNNQLVSDCYYDKSHQKPCNFNFHILSSILFKMKSSGYKVIIASECLIHSKVMVKS